MCSMRSQFRAATDGLQPRSALPPRKASELALGAARRQRCAVASQLRGRTAPRPFARLGELARPARNTRISALPGFFTPGRVRL